MATAELIDNEVREIITEQYKRTPEILQEHRGVLEKAVHVLLEKEKIDGEELKAIWRNPLRCLRPSQGNASKVFPCYALGHYLPSNSPFQSHHKGMSSGPPPFQYLGAGYTFHQWGWMLYISVLGTVIPFGLFFGE